MKKIIYILFSLSILIYLGIACRSDRFASSTNRKVQKKLPVSLAEKFPTLAVPEYKFELNQSIVNIETTKDGINILVPKNSLAYENGDKITEPIQVTFKSYLNKVDMMLKGLTTRSRNQLLVSGGMFEIQATVPSGRPIKIIDPWRVEVPALSERVSKEALIFDGEMEGDTLLNWINPTERHKRLTPVPFELLFYTYWNGEIPFTNFLIPHLDFAKYQNTWLATPELYYTRYNKVYHLMIHMASYYNERDKTSPLDSNILSIFLPYANEPLYKVDSAILKKVKIELDKAIKQGYIQYNHQSKGCDTFYRRYPNDDYYKYAAEAMPLFIDSIFEATFVKDKNIQYTTIDDRFLIEVDSVALRRFAKNYKDGDTTSAQYRKHKKRFISYRQIVVTLDNFGWKNIDYLLLNGTPPEEVLHCAVDITTNESVDYVLMVMDSLNTVAGIFKRRDRLFQREVDLPPNKKGTFIAIATTPDNKIKMGYIHTAFTKNINLNIELDAIYEPEEFKAALEQIVQ